MTLSNIIAAFLAVVISVLLAVFWTTPSWPTMIALVVTLGILSSFFSKEDPADDEERLAEIEALKKDIEALKQDALTLREGLGKLNLKLGFR